MKRTLLAVALLGFLATAFAVESGPTQRDHLSVQLVSNVDAAAPGSTIEVGLRLVHEAEWHTYWLNPGDSGLPTKLQWTVPADVVVSDIRWPVPHRMDLDPLTNFGYEGETLLPVEVSIPASAVAGTSLDLNVKASWLICREECIPGDAELQLAVPIGSASTPDARWQPVFHAAAQSAPQPMPWKTRVSENADTIEVLIEDQGQLESISDVELFPFSTTLIAHRAGNVRRLSTGELQVTTPKSDYFEALSGDANFLVAYGDGENRRGFYISTGDVTAALAAPATSAAATVPAAQPTLVAAFLFAFVGGLLLNLMPCVLPVLSLKALGLAEHAHDRATSKRHGLLYLAGTLVCFVSLAGILLGLRAAGEALGWGFQLQTPWVVASLAMLMTVMGLSLSGTFEFGTSWMGMGQQLTEGNNSRSAFFSGALAAIVASPCTAPFMGPALGFAVTQPAVIAIGVFMALALGLALPIVALSFAPALARWLPKPGAWMVRFKQLLAYPLYLTAIWLLWVLGRQLGADGMALTLVGLVALVLALWIWRSMQPNLIPRVAATLAFAGAAASVAALGQLPAMGTAAAADAPTSIARPWSSNALNELREQGKPVLVNMTAAWCITCLANERVALSSQPVRDSLSRLGVTYLKGDWTNRDENITQYLAQFGRNGVPLYVLYPSGGGEPEVLPQILTPTLVTTALERAAQR